MHKVLMFHSKSGMCGSIGWQSIVSDQEIQANNISPNGINMAPP
ncbi:11007_t:CDS:2 [Gigaspora margarita]|uniref:11007_t:CDS:1 n=1 Tax=Gigaspora margarita TaxID=4874 RepID=A0ABN7UG18_GIGMA|nr:11007_t:CDS:2 [Gigaspora margarita]